MFIMEPMNGFLSKLYKPKVKYKSVFGAACEILNPSKVPLKLYLVLGFLFEASKNYLGEQINLKQHIGIAKVSNQT